MICDGVRDSPLTFRGSDVKRDLIKSLEKSHVERKMAAFRKVIGNLPNASHGRKLRSSHDRDKIYYRNTLPWPYETSRFKLPWFRKNTCAMIGANMSTKQIYDKGTKHLALQLNHFLHHIS